MMRPMWIAVEHIVSVVRPADARLATLPLFWLCGVCLCGRVWRRGCSACGVGGWPWWSWWSPFPAELVCYLCSHGGANNIPSRLAESGCCKLARAACLHVDETRDTSGAFLFCFFERWRTLDLGRTSLITGRSLRLKRLGG